MKSERSRKKKPLLTPEKIYIVCILVAVFCAFMAGGFTFISIIDNTRNQTAAIVCAVMFGLQAALFIGLAISSHADSLRNIRDQYYLRFRN